MNPVVLRVISLLASLFALGVAARLAEENSREGSGSDARNAGVMERFLRFHACFALPKPPMAMRLRAGLRSLLARAQRSAA